MAAKHPRQTILRPRTEDACAWNPGRRELVAGAAAAAAILTLLAAGAAAELLRCAGADGRMIYTDNPALCPGADPFEPTGEVHGIDPEAPVHPTAAPDPSRRERSERRRRVNEAEAAEAARWRQRKLETQQELEQILARREQMRELVSHCNRGGQALTLDEAGIKRRVSCSVVQEEFRSLDTREASLRGYLDEGLREECRRAGCLPGWIR
jgi:hypothetical protein